MLGGELDEVDHLHVERGGQVRQSHPGWVLLAGLDPRDGDVMHIDLSRESFDAQGARLAEVADRGSKLGESRLRHGGSSASRDRVD